MTGRAVEADETAWGGKPAQEDAPGLPDGEQNQTTVLGMVERGGECALRVIICNLQQIELFTHLAIYGLDRVADADSSIY